METENREEIITRYLYGDLPPAQAARVHDRIQSDPEWRRFFDLARGTMRSLDLWDDTDVPGDLHDSTLALIGRQAPPSPIRVYSAALLQRIGPVVCGVMAAVGILWLSFGAVDPGSLSTRQLILCAVLWGGVYHLVFQILFRGQPSGVSLPHLVASGGFVHIDIRRAVLWGVVAFAVFMLVAAIAPNPEGFESRVRYREISQRIPHWFGYLLPSLYAAAGCFVGGFFVGRWAGRPATAHGTAAGMVTAVLVVLDLYACYLLAKWTPDQSVSLGLLVFWSVTAVCVAVLVSRYAAVLGARWKAGI